MVYNPYIPIDQHGIPFDFTTTSGYTPPSADELAIKFAGRPTHQATAYLQSVIDVSQIYQDSTHTYLKECPTIIVGFSEDGITKLKLPCVYGGIRDIGTYVYGNLRHRDLQIILTVDPTEFELPSYLKVTQIGTDLDLNSITRGWAREVPVDLVSAIKLWFRENPKQLSSYIKTTQIGTDLDLSEYLKVNQREYATIISALKGFAYQVPRDLPNTIRIWYRGNEKQLLGYLKQTFEGPELNLSVYSKTNQREFLGIYSELHSWQIVDFPAALNPMHSRNLGGEIRSTYEVNLGAYLYAVAHFNLTVLLQGYQTTDLGGELTGIKYGPHDIRSYIYPISGKDLTSVITVFGGHNIIKNLGSIIGAHAKSDLYSYIGAIAAVDLRSYLLPTGGYLDLLVTIVPKVVLVKRFINIALMEHNDLLAVINTACFFTGYKVLMSSIQPVKKKDLQSIIWTTYGDNFKDVRSKINTATIRVEDTLDISVKQIETKTSSLGFSITNKPQTADTLYFEYNRFKNLTNIIEGVIFNSTVDFPATIEGITNISYNSTPYQDPQFVGRETVINIAAFEDYWEREIEIQFSDAAQKYFWVDGHSKIYKNDRDHFWILRVEGYEYLTDDRVERGKVRSKYIFDLTKYQTIDDAIRDAIKRVSEFSKRDLASVIVPSGGTVTLGNSIFAFSPGGIYKSNKSLQSYITGPPPGDTWELAADVNITTTTSDVDISIVAMLLFYDDFNGLLSDNWTSLDRYGGTTIISGSQMLLTAVYNPAGGAHVISTETFTASGIQELTCVVTTAPASSFYDDDLTDGRSSIGLIPDDYARDNDTWGYGILNNRFDTSPYTNRNFIRTWFRTSKSDTATIAAVTSSTSHYDSTAWVYPSEGVTILYKNVINWEFHTCTSYYNNVEVGQVEIPADLYLKSPFHIYCAFISYATPGNYAPIKYHWIEFMQM